MSYAFFQLRHLLSSRASKRIGYTKWVEGLTRQARAGKSILDYEIKHKGYVSFDAADWNMHLSNSSYAKVSYTAGITSRLRCL